MSQELDKLNKLLKRANVKREELAEARGRYASEKKAAKEEFGTDKLDELKKLLAQLLRKNENAEQRLDKLSTQLEELLEEMEDGNDSD